MPLQTDGQGSPISWLQPAMYGSFFFFLYNISRIYARSIFRPRLFRNDVPVDYTTASENSLGGTLSYSRAAVEATDHGESYDVDRA